MNPNHVTIDESQEAVVQLPSPDLFADRKLSDCDLNGQLSRIRRPILKRPISSKTRSARRSLDQENDTPVGLIESVYFKADGQRTASDEFCRSPVQRTSSSTSDGTESLTRIALVLSICTEDLRFVYREGSYWIVGWEKRRVQSTIRNILHVGDQIIEVNGQPLDFLEMDLTHAFFASGVAVPVQLTIRPLPYGRKFVLRKPIQLLRRLGIVFEGTTIVGIEPGSVAANARLPSTVTSFYDLDSEVPAVVTEIDGYPLDSFVKTDNPYDRLGAIPSGQRFEIVLQPLDLVEMWRSEMRAKGYY